MQKSLLSSLAVCLAFTSCQVFEKSRAWDTVMSVRPGDTIRAPDPSAAYAEKLHGVLLEQGVEHLVVTYQYHYFTQRAEQALGTRTAVVYRDGTNPEYPWWLKDDRTQSPYWLPKGDLNQQLSFYCRRPAEVIEQHLYPAKGGAAKTAVALYRPAKVHLRDHGVENGSAITHLVPTKPAAPRTVASAAVVGTVASAPVVGTVANPPVGPREKPALPPAAVTPKIAKIKPVHEKTVVLAAARETNPAWTAPAAIDATEQASDPAPRDEPMEKLFRTRNGTHYDPTSSVDRRKMEQLKHGLTGLELPTSRGF